MATLDNQVVSFGITSTLNNTLDLQTASSLLTLAQGFGMQSGTGANQADKVFSDQRTIAASGTDPLDVAAGGLLDPLGSVFTVARLKLIFIQALAANTNNVVLGGGANPVINYMTGTTPAIVVRPGGWLMLFAPDATGYPVTAGTGDVLTLTNSAAGTSVTYNVVLIGSSA